MPIYHSNSSNFCARWSLSKSSFHTLPGSSTASLAHQKTVASMFFQLHVAPGQPAGQTGSITSGQAHAVYCSARKVDKADKEKQCSDQSLDMQLVAVVLWPFYIEMGFLYSLFCLTSLHTKNNVFKNPRSSTDGVWQHWCEASWSHCQELSHKLCAQLHAESHFANKGWVDDWEFLKMLVPVDFQSCSRKWRSWDWICLEEFCLPHWNQWWSFRGREVSQLDSCRFWMKSGSSHPPLAEKQCSNSENPI